VVPDPGITTAPQAIGIAAKTVVTLAEIAPFSCPEGQNQGFWRSYDLCIHFVDTKAGGLGVGSAGDGRRKGGSKKWLFSDPPDGDVAVGTAT
jgi:hypothetical protein